MGFYGFGQALKLAICEKCHNPKNSDNAVPARQSADDRGVMSLGHSRGKPVREGDGGKLDPVHEHDHGLACGQELL